MHRLHSASRSKAQRIAALYDSHAGQVWRTLVRLGVPSEHVEDSVHDVFVTAYLRLESFRNESQLSTWLVGIAVGVAANARRLSARRDELWQNDEQVDSILIDPELPADVRLERAFALRELEQRLSQLPGSLREVIVLIDLEQLTAPQAAAALNLNVNTV